jgi:hypothetical protein
MAHYHAVMRDEAGGEFGTEVTASDRNEAYDILADDYPESAVVQLESPSDTAQRQHDMYARLQHEYESGV